MPIITIFGGTFGDDEQVAHSDGARLRVPVRRP